MEKSFSKDPMDMDKNSFSVGSLFDPPDEKTYWLGKTPQERLWAVELTRRVVYGYGDTSPGLQRILEITQLQGG